MYRIKRVKFEGEDAIAIGSTLYRGNDNPSLFMALERAAKYQDVEDLIGTSVWLCYKAWDGKIIFGEGKVVLAILDKDGIILQVERRTGKYTRTHYNYGLNEFGREMYRTKEEAEARRKELEGNQVGRN